MVIGRLETTVIFSWEVDMETIYLVGAEDVLRAGNNISGAADTIQSAANSMSGTFGEQKRYMEEWMYRFETAIDKLNLKN